jgi:type I restriction enzyme S subunit
MNWSDREYAIGRGVASIRAKDSSNTKYLYACIVCFLPNLLQLASGSTFPNLSYRDLATFKVPTPPIEVQRTIASILTAYDDLIENNSRRIKLLEEMAQRIYREWFVNFRYSGHESVPLLDSELGLAPDRWSVSALSGVTATITRGVSPKYSEESEDIVLNQRCIRDGRLDLLPARRHSTQYGEVKKIRFGDILINSTGVGTLGRVAQVQFEPSRLTADSHVTIVRPLDSAVTREYLGMSLLFKERELTALGTGSTGQTELSRTAISEVRVLVPPLALQRIFADKVTPARSLAVKLATSTVNLQSARDLLLPRLISGELDVTHLDIELPEEVA